MKKRYTYILILTLVLALGAAGIALLEHEVAVPFQVIVPSEVGNQKITCWENDEDQCYVFLPGYADMADLQIVLKTDTPVSIDGIALHDGMKCGAFDMDTWYSLEYVFFGKVCSRELMFVRSDGVPAIFVSTDSGRTEFLHADKENKEGGTVSVYTTDGQLNYQGTADAVSGRGNYTWVNSDKKPYNIVLSQNADLLNMGMGSKWILLANASDSTLMRNKIVYDFANQIGLAYSPESQWVALYLNGEYRGLYLMCEAIEIGKDRVDLSSTEGAILTVETMDAFQGKNTSYFVTDAGVAVEINSPKVVTENKIEELKLKIQSVENAVLAEDGIDEGTSKSWEELINVSSWVEKYLIEEVFGNHDALMRSAYYYYQDSTSSLYAGPVWDYDLAMANEDAWQLQNPQTFWANRLASQPGVEMPWFYALYQKDAFYQNVVEMYQTEFLPELECLLHVTIPEYADKISDAAAVDKIRWDDDTELMEYVDWLCTYMEQRIEFLNSVWLDQQDYCIVRAAQQWGGYYAYYVAFTGDTLSELPIFENSENRNFVGWYNEKTGEPFDIEQPITEDMEIYAKWVDKTSGRMKEMLKVMPLAVIAVMGMALAAIEFYRWRKSR